jgi:hypothetical protein
MSTGSNVRKFLSRWSQRKREQERGVMAAAQCPVSAPASAAASFSAADIERLDFSSAYTPFLGADVPQEIASRALQKLWMSSDIIARPDDLDDYLEDFTEAAMALSPEAARSAYRVGRGVAGDDEPAKQSGEDANDVTNTADHSEEMSDGKAPQSRHCD